MTGTPTRPKPPRARTLRVRQGGFTLIEMISVIIILAILSAYLFTRGGGVGGEHLGRMAEVRSQFRYVQLRAMKSGTVLGLTCDGANYWAFTHNSTNPTSTNATLALPGESTDRISLTGKSMTMTAFTYFFDGFGIPYTAYTSASVNTKLAAPASITIGAGSSNGALTLTPETGYVP